MYLLDKLDLNDRDKTMTAWKNNRQAFEESDHRARLRRRRDRRPHRRSALHHRHKILADLHVIKNPLSLALRMGPHPRVEHQPSRSMNRDRRHTHAQGPGQYREGIRFQRATTTNKTIRRMDSSTTCPHHWERQAAKMVQRLQRRQQMLAQFRKQEATALLRMATNARARQR